MKYAIASESQKKYLPGHLKVLDSFLQFRVNMQFMVLYLCLSTRCAESALVGISNVLEMILRDDLNLFYGMQRIVKLGNVRACTLRAAFHSFIDYSSVTFIFSTH